MTIDNLETVGTVREFLIDPNVRKLFNARLVLLTSRGGGAHVPPQEVLQDAIAVIKEVKDPEVNDKVRQLLKAR